MGLHTHTCSANLPQDGCPACAEHAEAPLLDLDPGMLAGLVERTLRNRFGVPFGDYRPARSDTEARAMAVVMTQLERVGKIAETAPAWLALYLNERWRLETSIVNPRTAALAERDRQIWAQDARP
jgi:hypothetical protein